MMRRSRRLGILLGLALSIALSAPTLARDPNRGDEVPLTAATSSSGGVTTSQIPGNPYGCFSRSDLPHLSVHVPSTVDGQGNTVCQALMPREYVRATLFKEECAFFVCWWTQVSQLDKTKTWVVQIWVNPAYTCNGSSPSRRFRIETYSEVTGANGITYSGSTANESSALGCG
jgi:hypothetical protein